MAILNNNPLVGASGNQGGYNINNSLRFRSSASAYLNRTPASAGNRRTWTWSSWIKRGQISIVNNGIFSAGTSFSVNNNNLETISFPAGDTLEIASEVSGSTQYRLITTQLFRDPSAWYHVVVSVDTTQATASNRIKIYINGTQVTAFSTSSYPAQNYDCWANSTNAHRIGSRASPDFDGYLAEVNFIDGSAKTPSDFGETDTTTGVWKPKAYTGTYGTNGFYLKFSDIATTSGSNAGLGKDFSGNSNYWTTNNISVTSGTTYDAMTDVPTNTSATVANYATLNPLNSFSSAVSPTAANLQYTGNTSAWRSSSSTISMASGKWYAEFSCSYIASGSGMAPGIVPSTTSFLNNTNTANSVGYGYFNDGTTYAFGTGTASGVTYTTNDIIGIAFDASSGKIWFSKNGVWIASGDPATGTNPRYSGITGEWCFAQGSYSSAPTTAYANFGQIPFTYTPPTGFKALNTFNLPTPTILQGNKYMDATTYTGTGATQVVTNSGSMKPDLVWLKSRGVARDHRLMDTVRGINLGLQSDLTSAEYTGTALSSINSNGFTLNTTDNQNVSSEAYIAWQWQAGQGSTSSNTSGSITSTVSVNTTAGFSVVTYTGTGANATVGHGLGVSPSMIICKSRGTSDWAVYHKSTTAAGVLWLNLTNAYGAYNPAWNSTEPTSSVFSVGTAAATNTSATGIVAYCWAEIAGFSKFGSYTGNGSANGPFVFTNFRPKYILVKSTGTASWFVIDTARLGYNSANNYLLPNSSGAEATYNGVDILSNGFKVRNTDSGYNDNGVSYIYACFAENPFKNSLAR